MKLSCRKKFSKIIYYVVSVIILLVSAMDIQAQIVFSIRSGTYFSRQTLSLSSCSNSTIYYAITHSEDENLSFAEYQGSIIIDKNSTVYACGLDKNYKLQDTVVAETFNIIEIEPIELDFIFDGGREEILTNPGVYSDKIGTDYSKSPRLKFDNTGSQLIICLPVGKKELMFDYKFSNSESQDLGDFSVEYSVDGNSFLPLIEFYDMSNKIETKHFILNEATILVRFVYTLKNKGNVAIGNIRITGAGTQSGNVSLGCDTDECRIILFDKYLQIENNNFQQIAYLFDSSGKYFGRYFLDKPTVIIDKPQYYSGILIVRIGATVVKWW